MVHISGCILEAHVELIGDVGQLTLSGFEVGWLIDTREPTSSQ